MNKVINDKTKFGISTYSRLLKSVAITMLVAGVSLVQAQPRAAAKHPASVPDGYVVTPFGYFHPSCVNQLAKGDVLHSDEKSVEHANGSFDKIARSRAIPAPTMTLFHTWLTENATQLAAASATPSIMSPGLPACTMFAPAAARPLKAKRDAVSVTMPTRLATIPARDLEFIFSRPYHAAIAAVIIGVAP